MLTRLPRFAIFCMVVSAILNTPLYAEPPKVTLLTENFPPFNYIDKNQKITGFSVEVVQAIQRELNITNEINSLPWSRAYHHAQHDENTALFSMYRISNREELFQWVGPLATVNVSLMARSDFKGTINSIDDAKRVNVIGVQKDSAHQIYLEDLGFNNLHIVAQGVDVIGNTNIHLLINKRIDLWMATEVSAYAKAELVGVKPESLKPAYHLFKGHLYIAFSNSTSEDIIAAWQAALDRIKADGSYQKILEKYARYNIQAGVEPD